MSDLISREKLINSMVTRACAGCKGADCDDCDDCNVAVCLQAVVEAPNEQAEQVTRCKECRYWMPCTAKQFKGHHICGLSGYLIGENGFCLYGTRKDENKNEN